MKLGELLRKLRDLSMDEDDPWSPEQILIVERLRCAGRELLVALQTYAPDEFVEPEVQPEEPVRAVHPEPKVVSEPTSPKEARPSSCTVAPPPLSANCPVFMKDELLGNGGYVTIPGGLALSRCVSCLQVFLTQTPFSYNPSLWFACSPQCRDAHEDALREEAARLENAKKFGSAS